MIVTLINNDEVQQTYLIVVIEPDNLERMRKADPITFQSNRLKGILPEVKYPADLAVLIAYEEDDAELYKLAKDGDFKALASYLTRGYRFDRSEDGAERAFSLTRNRP
jgi:predicted GNAT superfamily acetyltransferase